MFKVMYVYTMGTAEHDHIWSLFSAAHNEVTLTAVCT